MKASIKIDYGLVTAGILQCSPLSLHREGSPALLKVAGRKA